MHELAADDHALRRVVAEHEAVDLRQVDVALQHRAGLRAAGFLDRALHAIDGARVRGQHVGVVDHVRILAGELGLQLGLRAQRGQEAGRGLRIVGRALHVAHAEQVRFELLLLRIAGRGSTWPYRAWRGRRPRSRAGLAAEHGAEPGQRRARRAAPAAPGPSAPPYGAR